VNAGSIGGVNADNEDIVLWDGTSYSLVFDGSDQGLSATTIDGISVIGPDQILLSFLSPIAVPGISGTVDDSDVVLFTATSLGENTVGSFTLYFDGSDAGLSSSAENVDAVELLPNGHLLFSTSGSFSVSGASGADADIIEFAPTSLGSTTAGTWSFYFDGSDAGLSGSSEDLVALAVDSGGRLYLSVNVQFSVPGASGADEDVFVFTPATLGMSTSGSYDSTLFYDGSRYGLASNDIFAIDLP
jgi:hypothetical protein